MTGYRTRPATGADLAAIAALLADCERELTGHSHSDVDTVRAVFARAGFDAGRDTRLVLGPDGDLAAWAWSDRRSEVDVHPRHRSRGIGADLLAWTEERARAAGVKVLVQTVSDLDQAATRLVRSRGFEVLVTSWRLVFPMVDEPTVPPAPAGITVRTFADGDGPAAHRVTEDAFDEWQERRKSYAEWSTDTVARQAFAPGCSPLAWAGDQLVGVVLSLDLPGAVDGYIERVAVRRDFRNRGIARLLLRHAFRAFHRAGRRNCTLWTHSNTGALALYERVGMTVQESSTVYRKQLS